MECDSLNRRSAVVALLLLASGLTGCDESKGGAPPPVTICGQVLSRGPELPYVYDASTGNPSFRGISSIYLQLTKNCDQGVGITLIPSTAATIPVTVTAKDGAIVSVEVELIAAQVTLRVHFSSGPDRVIELYQPTPPISPS